MRYGIGQSWTAPRTYIPTSGFQPAEDLDYRLFCYTWVAVSEEQVVLVDGGCDEPTATARGITWDRSPMDSLRVLGIDPKDVDDVVISHLHWDHAGNLTAFPNAQIHLHPAELRYATGPPMEHRYLRRPYDTAQLRDMVSFVHEGRVQFTDGTTEIAPGLTVHPVGGHTPGTQVVRVPTHRGPVVLASDSRHFHHNNSGGDAGGVPFSIVVHVDDYCAAARTVDDLAASPDHVIPGHDPSVSHRYPTLDGDELISRLDVAPEPSRQ
ncbi:glyoxylase-like metal-dependent hydrolase (beta-lactamase superfamily II) [Tamaricihabitans halophyticus]|uniref:Glyoxylase-like metal-dependent hydrolase (Beta-lactamase superfamily II) n=1 Tax=Tamaricihabitans halophyticus TaxID=1262583 RepID=A0A4R2QM28_9PSEU|nr:N-acyl homoserine lactonase family protein [Tamaricihabitans halophyticus]TCP49929.1 glyoxylase-like metal-dependent hydrolase (beta-lactamase superfamily II) [Tamaricihabitans halophyticus]